MGQRAWYSTIRATPAEQRPEPGKERWPWEVADLLSPQRIELNLPFRDKQAVLERLVELEGYGDAILDLEAFRRDMMAREAREERRWRPV